jgi:hypothetical protein
VHVSHVCIIKGILLSAYSNNSSSESSQINRSHTIPLKQRSYTYWFDKALRSLTASKAVAISVRMVLVFEPCRLNAVLCKTFYWWLTFQNLAPLIHPSLYMSVCIPKHEVDGQDQKRCTLLTKAGNEVWKLQSEVPSWGQNALQWKQKQTRYFNSLNYGWNLTDVSQTEPVRNLIRGRPLMFGALGP